MVNLEILCRKCAISRMHKYGIKYHDELEIIVHPLPRKNVRIVKGKSKYDFICEICKQHIKIGEYCFAITSWTNFYGGICSVWEPEFLDIEILKE